MKTKTHTSTTETTHSQNGSTPFFRQNKSDSFFKGETASSEAFFFNSENVQFKLNIGSPDDPYEHEADNVASEVVNGNGSVSATQIKPVHRISSIQRRETNPMESVKEIQRQEEEEELQMQSEEGEEELQMQSEEEEEEIQMQSEEEEELQIQSEEDEEELQMQSEEGEEEVRMQSEEGEEELQMQSEEEEEEVQMQSEEEEVQMQSEEEVQMQGEEELQAKGSPDIHAGIDLEKTLAARKGLGSPLGDIIAREMETGFGADFNGVRIHTDHIAIRLTKQLRAQAFTHGKDIYFNTDKFAPHSEAGKQLLAHELTHTIQQGAINQPTQLLLPAPSQVNLKEEQETPTLIRPELVKAIAIARAEIGKVNAKKTNADGTRIGWERLIHYFTIAFGGELPVQEDVIKYIAKLSKQDIMPSWCGIFVWHALKQGGLPIPDWVLGAPSLAFTKQRSPFELPVPGDIAYKEPFSHFAMVSEVENPDGNMNPKKARIRTINGNTAGEDNLGGQVQEKWHKGTNWLGYWNPVGNLNLPEVPLMPTDTVFSIGDESKDDKSEKETIPVEEVPTVKIDTSPSSSAIAEGDDAPKDGVGVNEDLKVELPEQADAGPAEKVAEVKAHELTGSSDESMVAFTEANPSQMAVTHPGLGQQLDGKMQKEQKEIADNPPKLKAESSGDPDAGLTSPDQLKLPAGPEISEGVTEADPGKLQSNPVDFKGASPNAENQKVIDKKEESGFMDWFQSNFTNFFNTISTKDDSVDTKAGERPKVNIQGEANPNRANTQRKEANDQVKGLRDETTDKLKSHPGQKNIKPKVIQETKTTKVKGEPHAHVQTPANDDVSNYANARLPEDVRGEADNMLATDLHANLNEAKNKTKEAGNKRNTDKKSEIDNAEKEVKSLNEKADKDQKKTVIGNRKKVATQQEEGIQKSYDMLGTFDKEANTKETEAKKAVKDKIKTSEEDASKKLTDAETEAESKKKTAEKDAAAEKEKLKKEKKKEGFFSRLASAVKKFVKAITQAIDKIFNALREAVKTIINKAKELAVKAINAARDFIVEKLNQFRDWAKAQVSKYLKDFPALAGAINNAIDTVVDVAIDGVNAVADTLIAGVEAIADALTAALDKILEVFQTALKAAVEIAGAVLTGDFAEALKIAIKAACKIAGIDPKPIFDFIEKAGQQLMGILKDPLKFFKNVVSAVGGGVKNFAKNIKKHLIKGLIGWLTGALSEVDITLPETFDIKGIFSLVMQVLGLTYENIKARVIKRFPPAEKIFAVLEKSFEIIKLLVTKGPAALWDFIKDSLTNLKEMVMGGIKEFVITTVVKEAITWLIGLLNPAGALVKALKLIFDFIMFLVERFQQIKDFVLSVYNSIVEIASGQLGKAMAAVEDALSRSLPVVISLLASLAGLGGIGKTVKKIIGKVTKPINKALDKIIDKIIKKAKKLLKKGKKKAKEIKDKLVSWWKAKKNFKAEDGKQHKVYLKGNEKNAKLMVASTPTTFTAFIQGLNDPENKDVKAALIIAKRVDKKSTEFISKKKSTQERQQFYKDKKAAIEGMLDELSKPLSKIFKDTDVPTGKSPGDAIPIVWYKPEDAYPQSITLVDGKGNTQSLSFKGGQKNIFLDPQKIQGQEKGTIRKNLKGDVHDRQDPVTGEPEYYIELGVDKRHLNDLKQPIKLNKSYRKIFSSRYQNEFRILFSRHGYELSGKDADHVRDLSFGGPDDFANLWPLNDTVNRSALKFGKQILKYKDENNKVRAEKLYMLKNKWFKIEKYKKF